MTARRGVACTYLGSCLPGRSRIHATAIDRGVPKSAPVWGYLGYAYAQAGRHEEAEKLVAVVSPNPFQQALILAGLDDKSRTFDVSNESGRDEIYVQAFPLSGAKFQISSRRLCNRH